MPSTYTLIASNVLTSSAASVTFSSIPSTYTDLVLRCSTRSDFGVVNSNLYLTINASSSTFSTTVLEGNGATASSSNFSFSFGYTRNDLNGSNSTSNTFSNVEIYLPSYTANANKPMSVLSALENNATTAYRTAQALLWQNTSAINQIKIEPASNNFVSGSSFYLYGIKNS
jgi:hypothetical protein